MPYEGPGVYCHYKGGFYEVVGLAIREDSYNPYLAVKQRSAQQVCYRPLTSSKSIFEDTAVTCWLRDLPNFDEYTLATRTGADGRMEAVPRFELFMRIDPPDQEEMDRYLAEIQGEIDATD